MYGTWKEDWTAIRERYRRWWNREGLIVANWGSGIPLDTPLREAVNPGTPESLDQKYRDPAWIAASEHYKQACLATPLDMLPIAFPDIGTVSLAPMLGATPSFGPENIWYTHDPDFSPENDRVLTFDENAEWWKIISDSAKAVKATAQDRYFTGLPAICPNLDALAEIRGTQDLMMDLILSPEWVHAKLDEIETAFEAAYSKLYDIVKYEDGSSVMGYFMVWAPGTICLAQCDTAAMISGDMYEEFVIPYLRRQCDFQDYSIYHVDGPMAVKTVDPILEIDSLDAVEFTPGPNVPGGGDPHWFDMYKKIKDAGKCVQVVEVEPEEIVPLLDAIGPDGTYVMVNCYDMKTLEKVERAVEPYRS